MDAANDQRQYEANVFILSSRTRTVLLITFLTVRLAPFAGTANHPWGGTMVRRRWS